MYCCPECGSEDVVFNGVDGFICCECSAQFFVSSEASPDGLSDNEVCDPGFRENEEPLCPCCVRCGVPLDRFFDKIINHLLSIFIINFYFKISNNRISVLVNYSCN